MQYAERLTDCFIFNKNYDKLIERFDTEDTLFYLDPPYKNTTKYRYGRDIDYNKLATDIKSIKGKFILSHYYDDWLKENFPESEYYMSPIIYKASLNQKN